MQASKKRRKDDSLVAKLLKVATKNDLKKVLGVETFFKLVSFLETSQGKSTLPLIKKGITQNEQLRAIIENSSLLQAKYQDKQTKKSSPEFQIQQQHQKDLNKVMRKPKKQYQGCLASQLNPDQYNYCLSSYDDPKMDYAKYSQMVPHKALRYNEYRKALQNGEHEKASTLQLSNKQLSSIRDLPTGIRLYMKKFPDDFEDYLSEVKAEAEYLQSIKNSVRRMPYNERQKIYDQIRDLTIEDEFED